MTQPEPVVRGKMLQSYSYRVDGEGVTKNRVREKTKVTSLFQNGNSDGDPTFADGREWGHERLAGQPPTR